MGLCGAVCVCPDRFMLEECFEPAANLLDADGVGPDAGIDQQSAGQGEFVARGLPPDGRGREGERDTQTECGKASGLHRLYLG